MSRTNSSSTQKSRCDKQFLNSDKSIDLNTIKDYKIKFKDIKIYENFKKYKTAKQNYNQHYDIETWKNKINLGL